MGTLFVNISGSFLIGVAYVLISEKGHLSADMKPLIMTGFLGALTTFSTFSLDTLIHIHNGEWQHAIMYTLLSIILCLISTFLAVELVRSFT
jgi:CrcB protein